MAVYIPAGRRRRRAIGAAVALLIVGLVVGVLIGRWTAPTFTDGVSSARDRAHDVIDELNTLPGEYERLQSGAAGKSPATFEASIAHAHGTLDGAIAKATWFGPAAKAQMRAALDKLVDDTRRNVPAAELDQDVTTASALIADEFGISTNGA